jgi:hypothetical protein
MKKTRPLETTGAKFVQQGVTAPFGSQRQPGDKPHENAPVRWDTGAKLVTMCARSGGTIQAECSVGVNKKGGRSRPSTSTPVEIGPGPFRSRPQSITVLHNEKPQPTGKMWLGQS